MDNKMMNINQSEEEALKIMENTSCIASDQLQGLKEDEECLQTCAGIAEMAIEMQRQRNILRIDTETELKKLHQKNSAISRKKKMRAVWAVVSGIAAAIVIMLAVRMIGEPLQTKQESIQVFQADLTAQQVTLQVDGTKEIKPLQEAGQALPSSVQLSEQKIDYHAVQAESIETGKNRVQIHRLSIPRGETFKVVLSDGTEVFLNSDSRLSYPTVFKGKERSVFLEGEGYFKVTRDTEHPFIVKSGKMQVRVLGTEFNVRSYSPDETCVTLIEGKVAVSDTCEMSTTEMKAGQSARLASNGEFIVNDVDIQSFLYWKEGYFYFDDVTLVDMMKEIGRWYNIDIAFRTRKIMDLRMHFFANRHQDIYHLIELLNRMESVHAYMESGKLIIE